MGKALPCTSSSLPKAEEAVAKGNTDQQRNVKTVPIVDRPAPPTAICNEQSSSDGYPSTLEWPLFESQWIRG